MPGKPFNRFKTPPKTQLLITASLTALWAGWMLLPADSASQRAINADLKARWGASDLALPPDPVILEQMRDAYELRQRREYTRTLDAIDPGEQYEDAVLDQGAIDARKLGKEALFAVGDDLFELMFRPEYGLGNGLGGRKGVDAGKRPAPNHRRVQAGQFGGPDAYSCAGCHSLGGLDGAGAQTQAAYLGSDGQSVAQADVRNPPHLLGLGPVERLAVEMTAELHALRDQALALAQKNGRPVRQKLTAKGVDFGMITAAPDGTLDTAAVKGVNADLIVRPFGWKGHSVNLREMTREAFRMHMGIVSHVEEEWLRQGRLSPGDYGDGDKFDIDNDGVRTELEDGMITTMVAYLSQLEIPSVRPPHEPAQLERFVRGQAVFEEVGCASCHRPELPLTDPNLVTGPESEVFAASPSVTFDVVHDGEHPKPETRRHLKTTYAVPLYSDLKRHDMGPKLASPRPFAGIPATHFLTRPLWGLADTAPYMHDGRAATLDEAILAHGGDAEPSRKGYRALKEDDKRALRLFLASLTREQRVLIP